MCVYAYAKEDVQRFIDNLEQGVAVSWKRSIPSSLTHPPMPMLEARSSLGSVLPGSIASSRVDLGETVI